MTMQILAIRAGDTTLLRPSRTELAGLITEPDTMVWVCMDSDGAEERAVLEELLHIHPLLVDDAFNTAQAPKIEDHGSYLYCILHGLRLGTEGGAEFEMADLDLFLGRNFLVTHYHQDLSSVQRVMQAVEKEPHLLGQGPAVVAHRLIDHMIDQYFPLMEQLDTEIGNLEDEILAGGDDAIMERLFTLKRGLIRLRRVGLYQRDILHRLSRGDFALIPESLRQFYRDVYDHFVRVTDEAESYRELIAGSLDAYLGMQSHKLNEVMKLLTIFSTVMLPLNFITGLYGMNFDYMPGLHWKYGYQTAIIAMVSLVVSLFVYFRKRKWT